MNKRLSLMIGIILFVLIICASYYQTSLSIGDLKNSSTLEDEVETEHIEELVYKGKFPIPVDNFIKVTSGFGYRNPVYNSHGIQISGGRLHSGIDLIGQKNSKVMCVMDGEVTTATYNGSYGNYVEIKHIDGDGTVFYTLYAHMQNNSLRVKKGDNVSKGQVIGVQGTTGNSTGDHLHFEVRTNTGSNRYAIDPAPYLFSKK